MKKFTLIVFGVFALYICTSAQTASKKTEKVKIYGNCDMCKTTIEGALKKKDGVITRNWDTETKILTVTYEPSKVNLKQILQKIADVGYDSDTVKASTEIYNKLPKCCRYDRPKK